MSSAAGLAAGYALAGGFRAVARAASPAAGWWTTAHGELAADPGGVLLHLPVGLSEGADLLEGLADLLADEPAFEPGALPRRDTELWIVGAEVASLSAAEGKVSVEVAPRPLLPLRGPAHRLLLPLSPSTPTRSGTTERRS